MSDIIAMMTCDFCEKDFPADARACIEAAIELYHPPEAGDEWKGELAELVAFKPDEITQEQREYMKAEMHITDEQVTELMTTGFTRGLGSIVCLECQATALEEGE